MALKKITFDRDDKCPICRKRFRSDACPHDYGEVMDAVRFYNASIDAQKIAERRERRRTPDGGATLPDCMHFGHRPCPGYVALVQEGLRLRGALEFYASQWEQDAEWIPTGPNGEGEGRVGGMDPTADLIEDAGTLARKTLKGET